ncbi:MULTISPECIES: DUF7511 domain-containing protein [Haloarcula]|uniref:DUF7511 domain-containing protein n=3 Tax=Haloarcula TaxID=2237 RepID=A0A847U4E0_HALAR|nr:MULTISPECIES: hypothetical protein [Haloarcula]EMA19854.1 hypothetical protein C443_13497 [Haloarcula argentinensis DSM 12282]MDS0254869.1 hypothetical protein [Haloarcula argentinensis]NLV13142.1 hypothetical protein [Haloarcula argentinensis]GGK57824.1 hypothetical protein GCM10009067_07880 [Haloarcula sebkhae]GGM38422.1 hypothetical protein GCM10009006_19510 [Haloarcula argentinensis]
MSATTSPLSDTDLDETPEFELDCLYDDPENPSELTIFPSDCQQSVTEWVTADRSATVSLEELR